MIVTLSEFKSHLRIETNDEDALLLSLLTQAQAAADDYCGRNFETETEESPEPVRLAVLLMAAHFYEVRDSSDRSAYDTMIRAFHALLYPHRAVESMF